MEEFENEETGEEVRCQWPPSPFPPQKKGSQGPASRPPPHRRPTSAPPHPPTPALQGFRLVFTFRENPFFTNDK